MPVLQLDHQQQHSLSNEPDKIFRVESEPIIHAARRPGVQLHPLGSDRKASRVHKLRQLYQRLIRG